MAGKKKQTKNQAVSAQGTRENVTDYSSRRGALRPPERRPAPADRGAARPASDGQDLRRQVWQGSNQRRAPGRMGRDIFRAEVGFIDRPGRR